MYKHEVVAVKAKVQKWGNSLGIRIPRALAVEVGVDSESIVDISINYGDIIITPGKQRPPSLRRLLAKVTAENLHEEILTGDAAGRELW